MTRKHVVVLLAAGVLAAVGARALTIEQWAQDLDQLERHLRDNHRNPFHTISETDFAERIGRLRGALPTLSGSEIVLSFTELLAAVGDGHTRLSLPVNAHHLGFVLGHESDPPPAEGVPRFGTLPVRFALYEEGLFVSAATQRWARLVGLRVEKIGALAAEAAVERIFPLIAADGESGRRLVASRWLGVFEVLQYTGIAQDRTVPITLAAEEGVVEVEVEPVAFEATPDWVALEHPPVGEPSRTDDHYTLEYLEDSSALLVTVYRLNDSPKEPIGRFGAKLARAIEEEGPDRVVLDLRFSQGGDQTLGRAVILPLVRWSGSSEVGRLLVLTSPYTFSAAVNLASRLEEWTQAVFVGEKPGSGPAHYSNSDREELSNSKLVARVSAGYFKGWTGSETRDSVSIAMPVAPRAADARRGVDTVLEAALSAPVRGDRLAHVTTAYDNGGINAALIMWMRYRTDPRTAAAVGPELGNGLGAHLMERESYRFAAGIYLFNREIFIDSEEAYLGESRAKLAMDDVAGAIASLEAGLEARPESASLRRALGELADEDG